MATYTFTEYLSEIATTAENLRNTVEALRGISQRHADKSFSSLSASAFTGTGYSKTEYDGLVVAAGNLLNTWWGTYGENVENFLTSTPGS